MRSKKGVYHHPLKHVAAKMPKNVSKSNGRSAGRPPGPRRRPNIANWRVMQWFDEKRKADGLSLGDVAHALGYKSASRVSQYFRQEIVPGPEMIRQIALAVGVSPIEALWRSEHYGTVLNYLNLLYLLGWTWMKEDVVGFNGTFGSDYVPHYVRRRGEIPNNVELDEVPYDLRARYHGAAIYHQEGILVKVSLVKPIACAILLAVGLFPRRGDQLRAESKRFIEKLSITVGNMLPMATRAARARGIPHEVSEALYAPLAAAEEILPSRFYGRMRLAVVAEYVHAWCDFASAPYAEYARLALYQQGAYIGDDYDDIWTWKRADMPTLNNVALSKLT